MLIQQSRPSLCSGIRNLGNSSHFIDIGRREAATTTICVGSKAMITSSTLIPPALLSPEVMARIHRQPECQLLWAILEEAVGTYIKYTTAKSQRGQRLFREANDWIMQDDYTWLCSFVNICHILGVDPDYLRTGLQRWRESRLAASVEEAA